MSEKNDPGKSRRPLPVEEIDEELEELFDEELLPEDELGDVDEGADEEIGEGMERGAPPAPKVARVNPREVQIAILETGERNQITLIEQQQTNLRALISVIAAISQQLEAGKNTWIASIIQKYEVEPELQKTMFFKHDTGQLMATLPREKDKGNRGNIPRRR